jgi:hypothetical protein
MASHLVPLRTIQYGGRRDQYLAADEATYLREPNYRCDLLM